MPLYEYECRTCGRTFEERQHFGDAPLQQCPQGHPAVRRIYAPAGLIFKGSGWYVTDSRKTPAESNGGESNMEEK
jgi:putative FmdB family regulatory protein